MGRNYSRKPARDVEAASETLIPPELGSSILRKKNETAPTIPVSTNLQTSPVFDDLPDKRTK
jgi:hypothetical protein